ncbi:hypothetical protein VTL71DRAFT_16502 [Oculimacula yallundae]|uniref:Uncharacterized protein n=1 Tax=Oculimacula yallundae TaxID=86028 RepID=A0ABR4CGU9_9HELO
MYNLLTLAILAVSAITGVSATPVATPVTGNNLPTRAEDTLPPIGTYTGVCKEDAQVCYYGDGSYPCSNSLECIESCTLRVYPMGFGPSGPIVGTAECQ